MFRDADYPYSITTYNKGIRVDDTIFVSKQDLINFILSLFKEPGKYDFDDSVSFWQKEGNAFNKNGFYCKHPFKSKDYREYWDDEKNKSRKGVIYKNGANTWYVSRDYYQWINFLPIFDKEKGKYDFPNIWDVQYHMALYEILAELHHMHASMLKKRQIASSYFHVAKLINQFWFEEGAKLKMGASLKDYINLKGSWKMAQEYADFLNEHTAWYRPMNPGKVMDWTQQIEMTVGGKDFKKGLKSTFTGHTFEKDPTAGVGGPTKYFFHEEGGIAPKADLTYEFMRPALHSGMISTGMFIIAGSVGDLSQCEPLKEYILNPEDNGFYAVESNLLDDKGTWAKHGLFIPEQWSMPPYIDEFGNSMVEEALVAIREQRLEWKKNLDPSKYQLRISQKPINIKEAFDYREESKFPLHLVTNQARRIEDKKYFHEYLNISRGLDDDILISESKKSPIKDFPVKKKEVDKEGCLVVWERPIENPEWKTYVGSIDPVSEGKTTTSDSLCSIYIYKNAVQITKADENGIMKTFLEHGRVVAAWCGRFDDITRTHERLRLIIEWYNAWTLVENNISSFIQYMISVRKQKYLVPKDQMIFLKSLNSNMNVFQEYGWKNTGKLFRDHMISYLIEFLNEEIDRVYDDEGELVRIVYGIERIPDIMAMKEMGVYHDGLNVDRLVTLASLVTFLIIQDSNVGVKCIIEETPESLEMSKNLFKLNKSPFKNIGTRKSTGMRKPRGGFRNLK